MTDAAAEGARVLREEAAALQALAGRLDAELAPAFAEAVAILDEAEGRIIVTGMGKSGHVGAKMAATFASTGSPSFFLHPGEASHGDLGMVDGNDVVLALSHTGGTRELSDLLAYCDDHDVPLIAITSRVDSLLGSAARVVLSTGVEREACPIGLAPMTSTTATLALGDALAAALMQRQGFTSADFARFHPGGKLGSRLLTAGKLMHTGDALPLTGPTTAMADALIVMSSKRLGHIVVVDAQQALLGIVSDGDIRRHMGPDLMDRSVAEVMTAAPLTVGPETLASGALELMERRPGGSITALPVVDDGGRLIGLLHLHDCLSHA